MTIILRGSRPPGVVNNLTAAEADGNIVDLDTRVIALAAAVAALGGGGGGGGAGTVQLSASTYTVGESAGNVAILVTRTGGSTGAASVLLNTTANTATAGSDFTSTSTTVNWGAGDGATKTVNVPIIGNTTPESSETFTVTLSGATGAALGSTSVATVTITDDDSAGPAPVNLTALTGITKSGSPDFLYTGASSGGDVTNQHGVSTVASTIGAAASVEWTVTDVINGDSGAGFSSSAADISYADMQYLGLQFHADLNVYQVGSLVGTVTSAFANGNRVRALTTSSSVLWQKSTDGGANYSTIYTQSGVTPQADVLRVHAAINGSNTLTGLKSTGLA